MARRGTKKSRARAFSPVPIDDSAIAPPPISTDTMQRPARIFVCSIGNPGSYMGTFHSAGHTVNEALARAIPSQPSFHKARNYANGLLSPGSDYYLWQSPTAMNTSGVPLAAAWRSFLSSLHPEESETAKLVVLHDEMEADLGVLRIRDGNSSPRGHNGLKSIRQQLRNNDYIRFGVGIGRPVSRDAEVVSQFVLRKMSPREKHAVESLVPKVLEELEKLRLGEKLDR